MTQLEEKGLLSKQKVAASDKVLLYSDGHYD